MRSPTRIPRLCACGAPATVGNLCAEHEAADYVRASRERKWSQVSDEDRAAVVATLAQVAS